MIDKIPTAEKILSSYSKNYGAIEGNPRAVVKASEALEAMIEFAKLHVKAALEAASEVASNSDLNTSQLSKIFNAYPENLIK